MGNDAPPGLTTSSNEAFSVIILAYAYYFCTFWDEIPLLSRSYPKSNII